MTNSGIKLWMTDIMSKAPSQRYVMIHDKLREYLNFFDFDTINRIMIIFDNDDVDITSLAAILITTKFFKENEIIKNSRQNIQNRFNKILNED